MNIAIDFDGTLVRNEFPAIGKPIPFAFETLKKLQKDGHLLFLWTVRNGEYLTKAVEFCRQQGVEFYAINSNYPENEIVTDDSFSNKLKVDLFIDDRNFGGLPDWGVIYSVIKEKRNIFTLAQNYGELPQKKRNLLIRLGEWLENI